MNNKYFLIVQLFSFCLCELSESQKEKLLNGFIDYYNNLPNQVHQYDKGYLQSMQQLDQTTYEIVANIKVTEIHNNEVTKLLKCTATVQDSDNDVTVINNRCQEPGQQTPETGSQEKAPEAQIEVTELAVETKPVQFDNEVHTDTAITSGEQFIAILRNQPSAPCIGCSSHVNSQAAGVSDLANLGVRHLDIHEPSLEHSLDSVIDVERQVQVVNGVRYILTLLIISNNCTEVQSENCTSSKICKITILVKPWVKLPYGRNRRAILANNCTEEWQYGDNGEVVPELSTDNRIHNQIKGTASVYTDNINVSNDDTQVKHNTNIQSQPNQERSLTDEEIKNLQDQIIPNTQFQETIVYRPPFTSYPDTSDVTKQHVSKIESGEHRVNSIPVTEPENMEQQTITINLDKKKSINDNTLDFIDSHTEYDDSDILLYKEFSESTVSKSDLEVKFHLTGAKVKKTEITEDNPNYYKYVQLADESLRNYLQNMNIPKLYTIVSIKRVTVQWDEAIKTLINFIISPLNLESSESQWKQCIAEIREQPWLHKKNIDVKCDLYTKRRVTHARVRRQLAGGKTERDPTNPHYKALADKSLEKYTIDSGITESLEVACVQKVTTQVVAGTLTEIDFLACGSQDSETIQCHSEIWDRPWLNNQQITVNCNNQQKRYRKEDA